MRPCFCRRLSKLFTPLRRNGTAAEADPAESEMLKAFFLGRKADAPYGPSRERLKSGGWLSTHMFLLPEPRRYSLIERAFQAGQEASSTPIAPERILLCGWYGTETLGDKATLGGILDVVRKRWPGVAVDLASLEPRSRMTVRQMPDLRIERVLTLGEAFATVAAAQYRAVAIAGGPLMSSIPWCTHLLEIFAAAKQVGTKCLLAGCGIGPLYVEYRNAAIKHLLELADEVVLRDQGSAPGSPATCSRWNENVRSRSIPLSFGSVGAADPPKEIRNKSCSRFGTGPSRNLQPGWNELRPSKSRLLMRSNSS